MPGYDIDNIRDAYVSDCRFYLPFDDYLSQLERYRFCGGGCHGIDASQCTFKLSDICVDFPCDVFGYFVGDTQASQMSFFLDNSNPGVVTWGVDSCDQSPVESADKPLLERRYLGGRAICAEDYLLAVIIEGVKGMEEFLLALLAFAQELDVVDYEDINGSKLVLKAGQISLFDCANEPVDEVLTA